ncbi:MAG: hypothetical protein ACI9QL_000441 [Candidatus Omnitrophota bacterium]
MKDVVEMVLGITGIYLALGLVFAIPFVFKGAARIDPAAKGSSWGFKLLVIPGVMALWPLLARRWLSGKTQPPEECGPHRNCGTCSKGGGA